MRTVALWVILGALFGGCPKNENAPAKGEVKEVVAEQTGRDFAVPPASEGDRGAGEICPEGNCIAHSIPPLPKAPPDGGYDHVVRLTGTRTGSAVASMINPLGPGRVLVRSLDDSGATIVDGMKIPRRDVTFYGLNLKGVFRFADGTVMWGVKAEPAQFRAEGADGWRIRDSIWSGGAGSGSRQGCVGNVYAQNFIGSSANWIIENSTLKNYVPTQGGCSTDHSEALYIMARAKGGTVRNNTFTNNGNTGHIFFTWWETNSPSAYPNDICVEGNTFGSRINDAYDIQARSELSSSLNISIDPSQGAATNAPSNWIRACP
jgi:hypothetical protein